MKTGLLRMSQKAHQTRGFRERAREMSIGLIFCAFDFKSLEPNRLAGDFPLPVHNVIAKAKGEGLKHDSKDHQKHCRVSGDSRLLGTRETAHMLSKSRSWFFSRIHAETVQLRCRSSRINNLARNSSFIATLKLCGAAQRLRGSAQSPCGTALNVRSKRRRGRQNIFNVDPLSGIVAGIARGAVTRGGLCFARLKQAVERQISKRIGFNEAANLFD